MYIKIGFFIFLGCTGLQGMEQKSFLNLLSEKLKAEMQKYPQARVDQPGARLLNLNYTILDPLRSYRSHPDFLKNIGAVISTASEVSKEEASQIAASLDIPEVTEWLTKQISEDEAIRRKAQSQFFKIVTQLGESANRRMRHPEEYESKSKEQERQVLNSLLYKTLENLLKAGVDVNGAVEYDETTPLMSAAFEADVDTVKFLLNHGARKDLRDKNGNTALSLAEKQLKAVQSKGAKVQAQNYQEIIKALR